MNSHDSARQSRRDAKKRKAKARAKAAAEHGSRIDSRKRKAAPNPSPFFGAAASLTLGDVIRRRPDFLDYHLGGPR